MLLLASGAPLGCASSKRSEVVEPPRPAHAGASDLILLDPGQPPLSELSYSLRAGASEQLLVSEQLTVYSAEREIGCVTLTSPLQVVVRSAARDHFVLDLALGPPEVERTGETSILQLAGLAADDARGRSKRLLAKVMVGKGGRPVSFDLVSRGHPPRLEGTLDTLLALGASPGEPLGVGARWQVRSRQPGAHTESDFELLGLAGGVARFRVWRVQVPDETPARRLRAFGEWKFQSAHWPMRGQDRMSFSLPHAPDSRVSARFLVRSRELPNPL